MQCKKMLTRGWTNGRTGGPRIGNA